MYGGEDGEETKQMGRNGSSFLGGKERTSEVPIPFLARGCCKKNGFWKKWIKGR